jgi:hypothetical protein
MIKLVGNNKDVKNFVYYVEDLYKGHKNYVYPIFSALKKEFKKIVLEDKSYKAILSIKNKEIKGRLLFTYSFSKKQNKEICYFSFFDCVNDIEVVRELFGYMEDDMLKNNISYSEGTFSPYDADTRRGVLIRGFDIDPTIFTSYNYEYYGKLLEEFGYSRAIDTVSLNADVNQKSKKRLNTISKYFLRSHDVRVDSLNWKNLDKDMDDVHSILSIATNEIVYQDAPSIEMIAKTAKQLKLFINPNLIKIARENITNKAIGFCLVLPDFNQVFKKTKGRIRPIRMIIAKSKISKARGTMQYIVPEYQNTGLIAHIFNSLFDEFKKIGVTDFEAGTMMENNPKPINAFKKFGGEVIKTYRIYGKEL